MRTTTIVLGTLLSGCATQSTAPAERTDAADTLTILHSSRLEGEIEPCG